MAETPDQDLEAKALLKRFGSHTAVDSLSFSVRRGSFFSILGPSGCGKTTLLRMIAGFEMPSEGQILIGGQDMAGMANDQRIRLTDDAGVFAGIIQTCQEMLHAVQPRAFFVFGFDDRPRRIGGVGLEEHRLLGLGVVLPLVERGQVHRAQLPLLERVHLALGKAAAAFPFISSSTFKFFGPTNRSSLTFFACSNLL